MEKFGTGNENTILATTNEMQIALAQLHGEALENFIETRASEFREIINGHPEYVEEFQNNPKSVLDKIEPLLYH